jgi:Aspartyl protease
MNTSAAFLVLGAIIFSPSLSADSSVKLRTVAGGYLLVPVTLNGAGPFEFLLDTGATTTMIKPALARRLELPLGERESIASTTSKNVAEWSRLESLTIGSTTIVAPDVLVAPLGAVGGLGARVQGVLGNDVLGRNSFLLSYAKERLEIDGDGSLAARVSGTHTPLHQTHGRLALEAEVPGVLRPLSLVLDSGCLSVFLFEKAPGDLGAALGANRGVLAVHTATGVRGLPTGELRGLRLAGSALGSLQALIVRDPAALEGREEDGLLPTSLFREFWFDHEGSFLILNPKVAREAIPSRGEPILGFFTRPPSRMRPAPPAPFERD